MSEDATTLAAPAAPDAPPRPLDRRVVGLWRLSLLAGTLPLALAAGGAAWQWLGPAAGLATLAALLLGGAALAALLPPARYRAWSLQLRAYDLMLRHGVLWRATRVVPHARIQHVDTRHGPLERRLGLARVVVFTAGSHGAALVIPGLAREEAEALRDLLAGLGGGDDAV